MSNHGSDIVAQNFSAQSYGSPGNSGFLASFGNMHRESQESKARLAVQAAQMAQIQQQMRHAEERHGADMHTFWQTQTSNVAATNARNYAEIARANQDETVADATTGARIDAEHAEFTARAAVANAAAREANQQHTQGLTDALGTPHVAGTEHPGTPLPDPGVSHADPPAGPHIFHEIEHKGKTLPVHPSHVADIVNGARKHQCGKCGLVVTGSHNAGNCSTAEEWHQK